MESIALRVIKYSSKRNVYVGTIEEWSILFGKEVTSVDQAITALRTHLRLKYYDNVTEAKRYSSDSAITISSILKQIEDNRIAEEQRIAREEQERQESLHREEIAELIEQSSTRVQLGRRTSVAGIDLFEVTYELDQSVDYDQLVLLQSETGLDVRLLAAEIKHYSEWVTVNHSKSYDGYEDCDYVITDTTSKLAYRTIYL